MSFMSLSRLLFLLAFENINAVIITGLMFLSANSNICVSSRFLFIDLSPPYGLHFLTSLHWW